MTTDEKYMYRCLQLARNGKGFTSPNPMVGAVVVHNGTIIGEGFHRKYGEPHAEVRAIDSVKDKSLLKDSTLYVSLEPCSHHGKTPPCSQLIIDHHIPRVVVACLDSYPAVSGKGIKMLKAAGVDVLVGVLKDEAEELNKEFFTVQTKGRPYVYLKWAQTQDGFIDRERTMNEKPEPTPISNYFTRMLVHKKRAEVAAIMIGTNTAVNDNPSLTTRFWYGNNPLRVVIDRQGRIPSDYTLFDGKVETIIFTEKEQSKPAIKNVTFIKTAFDDDLFQHVLVTLKKRHINAVLVEGGCQLLQALIDKGLWDEAYIEVADIKFGRGVKAPCINGTRIEESFWGQSRQLHLKPNDYKNL